MSWYYYEPSRRREVKGGIKAQSKRGSFGTTWWGKRWIATLEGFNIGARLGRGKSYARSGQVLSIDIGKGHVGSSVQGSRATPYRVTLRMATYEAADWNRIVQALRSQPFLAAKLLAGEMPPDLEQMLSAVGLPLFPRREADLKTDCSCPDWSNPCKHIAAVYYLLAEELDRDPFLLFQLRGKTRGEVLAQVVGMPEPGTRASPDGPDRDEAPVPILPDERFWQTGTLPEDIFGTVRIPPASAALPRRLGIFPFWRAEEPFLEALEAVYQKAAPRGLEVLQGETAD